MTLPEALELFEYWQNSPPEHELLAIIACAYTGWEPANAHEVTPEEHRASLERRWKAGAMNVKQMLEATGGSIRLNPDAPVVIDMGGIGPFPGATVH